MEFALVVY